MVLAGGTVVTLVTKAKKCIRKVSRRPLDFFFILSIFIKKVNSFPFCTHRVLKNTHSSLNKL